MPFFSIYSGGSRQALVTVEGKDLQQRLGATTLFVTHEHEEALSGDWPGTSVQIGVPSDEPVLVAPRS